MGCFILLQGSNICLYIDIYINTEALPGAENNVVSLDEVYLTGYLACLERLKNEYNLKDDISVCIFYQTPDYLSISLNRLSFQIDRSSV